MGWLFKNKNKKEISKMSDASSSDSANLQPSVNSKTDSTNDKTNNSMLSLDKLLRDPCFFKLGENDRYLIGHTHALEPDTFSIILFDKATTSFVCKSWEEKSGKSLNCHIFAIGATSWFAVTLDEYDEREPHTVQTVILFDNLGNEHLSVHYTKNGARNYGFSPSGKYFVLMGHDSFHVYDTLSGHMDVFFPDDMENTSARDYIVLEDQDLVTFCYTQHPDQPWYHFTFEGKLMEQGAFKGQLEKMNEESEESKAFHAFFNELHSFPRPLSPENYERFYAKLISYSQDPNYESAWLYREIGELELEMDKKSSALSYFKKALDLDPKIGVKRIASKLEKELEQ